MQYTGRGLHLTNVGALLTAQLVLLPGQLGTNKLCLVATTECIVLNSKYVYLHWYLFSTCKFLQCFLTINFITHDYMHECMLSMRASGPLNCLLV